MSKRKFYFICIIFLLALAGCTLGNGEEATPVTGGYDLPATEEILIVPPEEGQPQSTETPEPDTSMLETAVPTTALPAGSFPTVFTLFSVDPVLKAGRSWDGTHISPGAVVWHDGFFHMFYSGVNLSQGISHSAVGYAVSADGYEWVRVQDEPVFSADGIDYADDVSVHSVLVEEDNTWVMYFEAWVSPDGNSSENTGIGRATAQGPSGPWTTDDAQVLLKGNGGAWDDRGITSPTVIKTDDGYIMYYSGWNSRYLGGLIGMASSVDGITWTKYDDQATIRGGRFESDPVFIPDKTSLWDSGALENPKVWQTEGGWVMAYVGSPEFFSGGAISTRIGYATSSDGISWTRSEDNPIYEVDEAVFPDFQIGGMEWLYHEGRFFIYYSFYKGSLNSEIYLVMAGAP
ncbi:MAG: hypothetical protein OEZ02_07065 [Anaerolineae bacterium]|nr:hypothetical protein [Anaerolineae bacterium]